METKSGEEGSNEVVVLDFIDDDVDYTSLLGRNSTEELEEYYTSSKGKAEEGELSDSGSPKDAE